MRVNHVLPCRAGMAEFRARQIDLAQTLPWSTKAFLSMASQVRSTLQHHLSGRREFVTEYQHGAGV
jgi:hypothetical protein